uniref:Nedd4 family interacting protein 2 n=1 Tax=Vombatus ursinus TaxID=29139 RepID=A0A4X2LKW5_VOMUR
MDLHPSVTSRYQVLRNEENERESPAVEQASTSTQSTSGAAPLKPTASPSPPPYGPIPAEADTTLHLQGPCELFPVPPPYSVATSLPSYDEAEAAKAAALAASAVASVEPGPGEDAFPSREASTISDPDQLRVGNDSIFIVAFFFLR